MARRFDEVELGYLREVLASGQLGWAEGRMVTRFEEAFAALVGARYGIARNNAMNGLAQSVAISGAGAGTEVICDPLVHFGGVATLAFNAVPRFADVRYDTYTMDVESVRRNITPLTRALIVTNFWGMPADLEALRRLCDEHRIFMIEDCAHAIGTYHRGRHAGTFGDVGVFSFQQSKHLTTGDGGMIVTDRDDIHYNLYHEWAFGGESPAFMTLNFRMNEATAAIGLGQVPRVMGYVAEYTRGLKIMNEAIAGCRWLRQRTVPEGAVQSGYIWACTWEGDKHGLSHDSFRSACREVGVPVGFGFTQKPAHHFDIFRVSTAYHQPDCPVRCPYYTAKSDYRYHDGLTPVAADLLPRLVTCGLVEVPLPEVERRAALLQEAIRRVEATS